MDRDDLVKTLKGRKLFSGLSGQQTAQGEFFVVRKDLMGFYIAFKDRTGPVPETPNFEEWSEAKGYLSNNYQRLLDEEFERSMLTPENKNEE